jgi:CHASE3 domain sensor protein
MKLRDIKIETQLKISLGVIFLFVVILGATAWYQSELIWQQTQGIYDHPFAVRTAIGNLKADVLAINAELKDLVLTRDDHVAQTLYQSMALNEADANQQFSILRDRYLGPATDIDEAYSAFIKWKTVRDQISQLVQNGKADDATNLVSSIGLNGTTVANILSHINDISNFSGNKADQFMLDAQKQKINLLNQLVLMLILILSLGTLISYFLIHGITTPLRDLTSVALNFGNGKLNARSQYSSKNELGHLAVCRGNKAKPTEMAI